MTKGVQLTAEQTKDIEELINMRGQFDEFKQELEDIKGESLSQDDYKAIAQEAARIMRAHPTPGENRVLDVAPPAGVVTDPGLGDLKLNEAVEVWVGTQVQRSLQSQLKRAEEADKLEMVENIKGLEEREVVFNTINQRAAEQRADRNFYAPGHTRSNQNDPEFTECGIDFLWEVICQGSSIASMIPEKPAKNGRLKWRLYGNRLDAWGANPSQDCSDVKCTPTSTADIKHDEAAAKVFRAAACFNLTDVEDAYWDLVNEFSQMLIEGAVWAREFAINRGDLTTGTVNINSFGEALVTPTPNTVPSFAHWDGLQHAFLVDNPGNNGNTVFWDETAGPAAEGTTPNGWFETGNVLTYMDFQRLRGLMVDEILNRNLGHCGDLVAFVTAGLFSYLPTLDEFNGGCCGDGPAVTGRVPDIGGTPVFWSEHMPMTNEYGHIVYSGGSPDATANIYHTLQLVHLKSFLRGPVSDLQLKVEVDDDCEIIKPMVRWREALGRRSSDAEASGIEGIAGIPGISLTPPAP